MCTRTRLRCNELIIPKVVSGHKICFEEGYHWHKFSYENLLSFDIINRVIENSKFTILIYT